MSNINIINLKMLNRIHLNELVEKLSDNSMRGAKIENSNKIILSVINDIYPNDKYELDEITPSFLKECIKAIREGKELSDSEKKDMLYLCEYVLHLELPILTSLSEYLLNDKISDDEIIEFIHKNIIRISMEINAIGDTDILDYFLEINLITAEIVKQLSGETYLIMNIQQWFIKYAADSGNYDVIRKNIINTCHKSPDGVMILELLEKYSDEGSIPHISNYYDPSEESIRIEYAIVDNGICLQRFLHKLFELHVNEKIKLTNIANILPTIISITLHKLSPEEYKTINVSTNLFRKYIKYFYDDVPLSDFELTIWQLIDKRDVSKNDPDNYLEITNNVCTLFQKHSKIIKSNYSSIFSNFCLLVYSNFTDLVFFNIIDSFHEMIDMDQLFNLLLSFTTNFDFIDKVYEYLTIFDNNIKVDIKSAGKTLAQTLYITGVSETSKIFSSRSYFNEILSNLNTSSFFSNESCPIKTIDDILRIKEIHNILNIDFLFGKKECVYVIKNFNNDELINFMKRIDEISIDSSQIIDPTTPGLCKEFDKYGFLDWLYENNYLNKSYYEEDEVMDKN